MHIVYDFNVSLIQLNLEGVSQKNLDTCFANFWLTQKMSMVLLGAKQSFTCLQAWK